MMVRDASAQAAAGIAAIINPVIRDTTISFKPHELDNAQIEQMIRSAHGYFVAENEGRIVGFASYSQFRGGDGYRRTMEHTVMVAPEARGMRVGQALMSHLEDHARSAGIGSLWAGVSADNPAGRDFHARIGFEYVCLLPKVGYKFGKWRDLHLMRKWLNPDGDALEITG